MGRKKKKNKITWRIQKKLPSKYRGYLEWGDVFRTRSMTELRREYNRITKVSTDEVRILMDRTLYYKPRTKPKNFCNICKGELKYDKYTGMFHCENCSV